MKMHGAAAGLLVVALVSSDCIAQDNLTVIMSGLDNPRGLALGPDGGIYVAEAGRGGNGPEIIGGEGRPVRLGATSAVSRYLNGTQQRVITGLPSLAEQTGATPGGRASGLQDIVFTPTGEMYGLIGQGGDTARRAMLGAEGAVMGHLVRLPIGGAPQPVADIGAFEAANNPDGFVEDYNPFGLLSTATGFAVADAGMNALLTITPSGVTSTRAVFPNRPNPLPFGPPTFQSVPTTVTTGPDGAYYVGQLTGFPFPPGSANIYRVDPQTGATSVAYDGFTNIIDLTFGPDGDLYVLQNSTNGLASQSGPGPGRLVRIDSDTGERTTVISDPLFFPAGLLVAPDGKIYVSNLSVSAGGGQVLLVPEPATGAVGLLIVGAFPLRRRRVR